VPTGGGVWDGFGVVVLCISAGPRRCENALGRHICLHGQISGLPFLGLGDLACAPLYLQKKIDPPIVQPRITMIVQMNYVDIA